MTISKLAKPGVNYQRVIALRKKHGWTTTELAKRAEISTRRAFYLEHGEVTNVSAVTLKRLAQVLGTSTDFLLDLTDKP